MTNTEVMTVTKCFHKRLMSYALNKINFVWTFYIYLPWLQVKEGGGIFLTKMFDSENQDFCPYLSIHLNTWDIIRGRVFIKKR